MVRKNKKGGKEERKVDRSGLTGLRQSYDRQTVEEVIKCDR